MPKISTYKFITNEGYETIAITYSTKDKVFKAQLPESITKIIGNDHDPYGNTEKEIINKLNTLREQYKEAFMNEEKIIILDIKMNMHTIIGDIYIDKSDIPFANGVALYISAGVFIKRSMPKYNSYYPIISKINNSYYIKQMHSSNIDKLVQIPWTQEAEDYIVSLIENFENLIYNANSLLSNKESLLKLISQSNQLFLPEKNKKKSEG